MRTFENPPIHYGQQFANQTLEWLPTDTEENYKKLIQNVDYQAYIAELGWDCPGAITYKFNSQGFRADEFDDNPCMIALGCSFSIGIGLPDETTWPRLTAAALGLKCANLSWGGYSADSCFRLAEYWIPVLRPKYVCMLTPPRHRVEVLLDQQYATGKQLGVEVFLPESRSRVFSPNDHYLKHWFLNDENSQINHRKNTLAIQQLCSDLNIPCNIINSEKNVWHSLDTFACARDAMHAGPEIHNKLTEKFINGYKK